MRDIADRIQKGRHAIAVAKARGLDTTKWEAHLRLLLIEAGKEPVEGSAEPWLLWEWRRISLPQWREALEDAVAMEDNPREAYARWMLRDILFDPDYEEIQL